MDDFIRLCRVCSLEEFAQAGGGNISVKDGSRLCIKASGVSLSEVTYNSGYSIVDNQRVLDSLAGKTEPDISTFILSGTERPSLEVYFHSFLKKYVVHIHPTSMNKFLCSKSPNVLDYGKPGFLLSKHILSHYIDQPVIYLKNHGVIFHADEYNEVLDIIKSEHNKFKCIWSTHLDEFWDIQKEYSGDFIYRVPYTEANEWTNIVKNPIRPFTPDIVLFLTDSIIVRDNSIYIRAKTKQKCLSILEVLRCYCYTYDDKLDVLTDEQVSEILNWDVEKYRKLKP